jgi:hypothetical protein
MGDAPPLSLRLRFGCLIPRMCKPPRVRRRNAFSDQMPEVVPVALTLATLLFSLVWNAYLGISWRSRCYWRSYCPWRCWQRRYSTCASEARRPRRKSCSTWASGQQCRLSVYGYHTFAFSLGYPLKDSLFLGADHALGLDWRVWALFSAAYPCFWQAQRIAYHEPPLATNCSGGCTGLLAFEGSQCTAIYCSGHFTGRDTCNGRGRRSATLTVHWQRPRHIALDTPASRRGSVARARQGAPGTVGSSR